MSIEMGSPFFQRGNWNLVDDNGHQILFRILAEDDKRIYWVKLGRLTDHGPEIFNPPKTKSKLYRHWWTRVEAEQWIRERRLIHIGERALPPDVIHGVVKPRDVDLFKKRRKVVYSMVRRWRTSLITSNEAYIDAIKLASLMHGTDKASIKKWLEQYYFFGKHKFALIPLHSNKGKTGPRRGAKNAEGERRIHGRKVAGQVEGARDMRYQISKRVAGQLTRYLEIAVSNNIEFGVAIDGFIETRYAYSKKDGEKVCYNVSIQKLGGRENLTRLGRAIYKIALGKKLLEDKRTSKSRVRLSGGTSRTIAHDQLMVMDIDGTTADNQMKYGGKEIFIPGHGKPTLMLGAERESTAVMGYYVTFKAENAECYQELVKSAFTSKERDLIFHGMEHLEGFVYGCTSKIFIDRGPGMANRFQEAIERLRISTLAAAPGDPKGKGLIEGLMKYIQKALSELPGSTFKKGDEQKDYARKKAAETVAVSYNDFMQALLTAISRWNMRPDRKLILTEDMIEAGVAQSPEQVFLYKKSRLRGDAAFVWPQEEVFRKLYHSEPRIVDDDGIVEYKNGYFTSDELFAEAYQYKIVHGKSLAITIYDLGHNGMHLLWDMQDGNLGLLSANNDTARERAPSKREVDIANRMRASLYREAKKRSQRNQDRNNNILRKRRNAISQRQIKEMAQADKRAVNQANAQLTSPAEARKAASMDLAHMQLAHSVGALGIQMDTQPPSEPPPVKLPAFRKAQTFKPADDD